MPDLAPPRSGLGSSPGAHLYIGLSAGELAIVHRSRWWRPQYKVLLDAAWPEAATQEQALADTLADTLQTGLKQTGCSKLPATLILDDGWVRYFMVSPPKNASGIGDCHAAANRQFDHLYGEAPQGWQINAAWDAQHPFLACALPRPVLKALEQAAHSQKIRLLRITPHFIACWNKWQTAKSNAWFGLVHGGQLNLAAVEQGRLKALRQSALTDALWQDPQHLSQNLSNYLPNHLQREALRLSIKMPTQLVLIDHSLPRLPGKQAKEMMGTLECQRIGMATPPWLQGNAAHQSGLNDKRHAGPLSGALALAALGVQK